MLDLRAFTHRMRTCGHLLVFADILSNGFNKLSQNGMGNYIYLTMLNKKNT